MKNASKAILATIAASAGMAGIIFDKRGAIKRHAKRAIQSHGMTKPGSSSIPNIDGSFRRLAPRHKNEVRRIVELIMPADKGFKAQQEANRYRSILGYLCHRYEFHISHASRRLSIPYVNVENLAVALVCQNIMEYTSSAQFYVRQIRARRDLQYIQRYFNDGLVKPSSFKYMLLNLVAYDKYFYKG